MSSSALDTSSTSKHDTNKETDDTSDEDELYHDPIMIDVGGGNYEDHQSLPWCILGCIPCIQPPKNETHFELIYILIHTLIGIPIYYIVFISQALYYISNGYISQHNHFDIYSFFWLLICLLLFLTRIFIWVWRFRTYRNKYFGEPLYKYHSGSPSRQIIYTIGLVLYLLNILYFFYWRYLPNNIVLTCIVFTLLDLLGYIMDIIMFFLIFPNEEITHTQMKQQQQYGNVIISP